jgi:hypothetical protein
LGGTSSASERSGAAARWPRLETIRPRQLRTRRTAAVDHLPFRYQPQPEPGERCADLIGSLLRRTL